MNNVLEMNAAWLEKKLGKNVLLIGNAQIVVIENINVKMNSKKKENATFVHAPCLWGEVGVEVRCLGSFFCTGIVIF